MSADQLVAILHLIVEEPHPAPRRPGTANERATRTKTNRTDPFLMIVLLSICPADQPPVIVPPEKFRVAVIKTG